MKRLLVLVALVLTVGVGSLAVYADTATTSSVNPRNRSINVSIEDRDAWFKERTEYKKEQIKKAVEEKLITEEDAKQWEEHFTYMEEFHNENGFMAGGCGGNGMMRGNGFGNGLMRGNGFGNGMMRGNSWGR